MTGGVCADRSTARTVMSRIDANAYCVKYPTQDKSHPETALKLRTRQPTPISLDRDISHNTARRSRPRKPTTDTNQPTLAERLSLGVIQRIARAIARSRTENRHNRQTTGRRNHHSRSGSHRNRRARRSAQLAYDENPQETSQHSSQQSNPVIHKTHGNTSPKTPSKEDAMRYEELPGPLQGWTYDEAGTIYTASGYKTTARQIESCMWMVSGTPGIARVVF